MDSFIICTVRIPENGVFSDQAVRSFHLKPIRTEMGRAKRDSGSAAEDLGKICDVVRRVTDEVLWASFINYVLRQARDNALATRLSHSMKIEKLADRHDRSQQKKKQKSGKVLDEMKLPGWVEELPSMGPKHPE